MMSRTRRGRKSWETRMNFNRTVGSFAAAYAAKEFKFSTAETKAMVIIRTDNTGRREIITFNQAYGELSLWEGKAFTNVSPDAFSDMLCETFKQRAVIFTRRASYRLWTK